MDKIHGSMGRAAVSVIIPCFCCAETIDRAVASVVQQTLLPAELILVDDASPDGETLALLSRLQKLYEHTMGIKVLSLRTNCGAAAARNEGWAAAGHPYVAFLDADDAFHPRKIEIQYKYLMSHPDVVLCGHNHRILERSTDLPDWVIGANEEKTITRISMLLSNPFVTPSVMVRRDIPHRFLAGRRHMEDHLLWMQIACEGFPIVKLSADLAAIYKFSFGVGGLSSDLWAMEKGEIDNYVQLYRNASLNRMQVIALALYSLLKYVRRLGILWIRRLRSASRSATPVRSQ